MSVLPDRGCDPERVFELADGGLTPEERRQAHSHLEDCPECRALYERELEMNDRLGSLEFPDPGPCSVSRQVAMALPTRAVKARLLWALAAAALLVVTLLLLGASSMEFASLATGAFMALWSFAAGVANATLAVLDTLGPWALAALTVGAFLDLVLAAVVFSAARLSRRA